MQRRFLSAWPHSSPMQHVNELIISVSGFERCLELWNISPVEGGVDSKDLYHGYIMVWIQDLHLTLLGFCKAEKGTNPILPFKMIKARRDIGRVVNQRLRNAALANNEAKKEVSGKHVESSGVLDTLTRVLVSPYKKQEKPSAVVE